MGWKKQPNCPLTSIDSVIASPSLFYLPNTVSTSLLHGPCGKALQVKKRMMKMLEKKDEESDRMYDTPGTKSALNQAGCKTGCWGPFSRAHQIHLATSGLRRVLPATVNNMWHGVIKNS